MTRAALLPDADAYLGAPLTRVSLTRRRGTTSTPAFAANAAGAPLPIGISCWTGEGLARSTERENAIVAALDVG
jgi:hypothetical protein